MRTCTKCKAEKEPSEFNRMAQAKDGLRPNCKACDREWRKQAAEARSAYQKHYRAANPEFISSLNADWMKRNAESQRQKKRAYQQANLGAYAARNAKRLAAQLRATPSWADDAAIRAIYEEAARLTELTGIQHHVDHIVPLQSPWVCGLHCEANLRIIPSSENQSKSNRWWPDMPDLTGCVPDQLVA